MLYRLLCARIENVRTLEISPSKPELHKYLSKHDRFIKNKLNTSSERVEESKLWGNLRRSDLCCRSHDIELEIQPLVPIY